MEHDEEEEEEAQEKVKIEKAKYNNDIQQLTTIATHTYILNHQQNPLKHTKDCNMLNKSTDYELCIYHFECMHCITHKDFRKETNERMKKKETKLQLHCIYSCDVLLCY